MSPPPRNTAHYHATSSSWHIYDRLLDQQVGVAASMLAAAAVVRGYEAMWRGLCERWQREEGGADSPPSIF
jgi:hypothetical protein